MSKGKDKWEQYWVYYSIPSQTILNRIQDELKPLLPPEYNPVKRSEFHMTVHPQFQFPEKEYQSFNSIVRDIFPRTVTINSPSFHYYPSRAEPRVICLDAHTTIGISQKRNQLLNSIWNQGGESVIDPVEPHITVFSIHDPHKTSYKLPPNINEIYDKIESLEEKYLSETFTASLCFEPTG